MRARLVAVGLCALALAACGSDDKTATTPTTATTQTASQVEAQVKAQLEQGGAGGVVDLDGDPPKIVTCQKQGGGWSCKVKTTKGRSMLCLVPQSSESGARKVPLGTTPPDCRGIDY
jgi:hypothetical protein